MQKSIDGFANEVHEQIGQLDQTIKELLQFVSRQMCVCGKGFQS
jgi:hypothetical protein